MRRFTRYGLTTGLACALTFGLVSCGGNSTDHSSPRIAFNSVVSFGDSLSDAGTYRVGLVAASQGGLFTVNGNASAVGFEPVPSFTWAQLISATFLGQVSCAARTGGFGVGITTVAGCTNYAQGGARITDPIGTNHANGALTEPVVAQVAHYLSSTPNGRFTGAELITVQGGANELFAQADILSAAAAAEGTRVGAATFSTTLVGLLAAGATNPATAAQAIGQAMATEAARPGSSSDTVVAAGVGAAASQPGNAAVAAPGVYGPMVTAATSAAATAGAAAAAQYVQTTGAQIALTGMVTAAAQLGASIQDMVNKGAQHVVVTNMPDVSLTPYALGTITVTNGVPDNATQQLILAMTQAFNAQLQSAVAGVAGVLFVDVFTQFQQEIATPSQYGLSNVKDVACDLRYGINALATTTQPGSSLVCNTGNLVAGDTSRYLFADSVHPTPYGHKLLAQVVIKDLVLAGWL